MSKLPIDLNWEKMILLLNKLQTRGLSRDEGRQLKPLLEQYYEKAVLKKDRILATKLGVILMGLEEYISGEISESEYKGGVSGTC